MNFHAAMIMSVLLTRYQPGFLTAGNQGDNAIWRCLKTRRQLADSGPVSPRKTLDVQEQKVLQWRDSFGSYRLLGEPQEPMQLMTEFRKLLETSLCYRSRVC